MGFSELDVDGVDTTVVVVVEEVAVLDVIVLGDIGGMVELEVLTEEVELVEKVELLENGGSLLSGGVTLSALFGTLTVCVEDDPAELPGAAGFVLPAELIENASELLSLPVDDTVITAGRSGLLHPEPPHIINSDSAAAKNLPFIFN